MSKQKYDNSSISALKGADRVRLKPEVIFGSNTLEGCCHSVFEILSNSIDEARDGYGSKIIITKYLDGSIQIEDFGRGIPVDWNPKEKEYNYKLLFEEMYAGGKYKNGADANYAYSLGLNGLGLCSTQYASEYMDVTVYRDGYIYSLHFEKGIFVGELKKKKTRELRTGTIIKWRPDIEVFTDINVPTDYFMDMLKRQSITNKGLHFIFKDENSEKDFSETEFFYENGIVDYINELTGGLNICTIHTTYAEREGADRADRENYKVKIEAAYTFNQNFQLCEYYHNSSWLEHGGSPDKAVKNAFLAVIDNYANKLGKYTKGESKITIQDILDCLIIVTNSFSTQTSYENQTKKSINNKFIQEAMTNVLKEDLEVFFAENADAASKILDQILINKRSRETAEKSRVAIKKKLSGNLDMQNRVAKFVDCRVRDAASREVFIVEGDSALGSCKLARDSNFQAIMPIRGKILNCLKADLGKIFKSEIITDLLKVLGCGVEVKVKGAAPFNLKNLRWNKIIICTDGDVDGYQIRTLILTMIFRLMPTLITEGKVFIVESPLYEITYKDKTYFAYTDSEKNKIVSRFSGKYSISRSKGLGENNPDMMWTTTMSPESRRLIKITPNNLAEMQKMFDLLLGDNLAGRKKYIEDNGHLYLDNLDVE